MNIDDFMINFKTSSVCLKIIVQDIANIILHAIKNLKLSFCTIFTKDLGSPIEFTELQITLLKVLLFILLTNFILIWFFWAKYGSIINEKFIRPSTLKEIEALKSSVAKLKLPKEHSPRI